jgi:4-aminobutyrate--pyruvate transaminase
MEERCREHGLIVRALMDSVALCPPLIISEEQIDEMFARYTRALDDVEAWVSTEGLREAA